MSVIEPRNGLISVVLTGAGSKLGFTAAGQRYVYMQNKAL
jgi:hypothetical protein